MKRRSITGRDLFWGTLLLVAALGGVAGATVGYSSALGFSAKSTTWAGATSGGSSFGFRWDNATDSPFAHRSSGVELPMTAATSSITPGGYTNANVTVDQYGRITAVTNGLAPAGGGYTTLQQSAANLPQRSTANFTARFAAVDNAGAARTDVDLASSGVAAGSYTTANITVDAFGRITTASSGTPTTTLQQAYTNGAAAAQQDIQLDSTRNSIVIHDTNTPLTTQSFGVWNPGGTVQYFNVIGSGVLSSGFAYPGIRVYQNINAWNGNTLSIGSDRLQTTGVTLGAAQNGAISPVDVTVAHNLTVNGSATFTGASNTTFSGGLMPNVAYTYNLGSAGTPWLATNAQFFNETWNGSLLSTITANEAISAYNNTAAALGTQQYSPIIALSGQGFGTTGGATQGVKFGLQVVPVQGATATGSLNIFASLNGGAYGSSLWSVDATGNVSVAGTYFSTGVDRTNAGTFSVCGANCTTLQLGGTASTAQNFQISGATKWTLNSSGNLVAAAAQTVDTTNGTLKVGTIDTTSGTVINLGGTNLATLQWATAGGTKGLTIAPAAVDTTGVTMSVLAGQGGTFSASAAGAGGLMNIRGGIGGTGDATHVGAAGGAFNGIGGSGGANLGGGGGAGGAALIQGGTGAAANGASAGAVGGTTAAQGGTGGAGSAGALGGSGASASLTGGTGGTDGGGGAGAGGIAQVIGGAGNISAGGAAGAGGATTSVGGAGGAGLAGTNGTSGTNGIAGALGGGFAARGGVGGVGGAGGTGTTSAAGSGANGGPSNGSSLNGGVGGNGGAGGATSGVGAAGLGGTGGLAGAISLGNANSTGGVGGAGGASSGGGTNGNGGAGGGGAVLNLGTATGMAGGAGGQAGGAGATSGNGGVGGGWLASAGNGGSAGAANGGTQGNGGTGGSVVLSSGAGGPGAVAGSAGTITLQIAGANKWQVTSGGNFVPAAGDAVNQIGGAATRVSTFYGLNLSAGDSTNVAAADTAGSTLSILSQKGGIASVTGGGAGGGINLTSQNGGAGTATPLNGGASGGIAITVGTGGASGGAGSTAGAGAALTLTSGTPGAAGAGTGAASGDIIMNIPAPTGAANSGTYRWRFNGNNYLTFNTLDTLTFNNTASQGKIINVLQTGTDTAGNSLSVAAGNAGAASASGGGIGGAFASTGGTGGGATSTFAAGAGGTADVTGGGGGAGAASAAAAAGGQATLRGGTGGVSAGTGAGATGGVSRVVGGAGGGGSGALAGGGGGQAQLISGAGGAGTATGVAGNGGNSVVRGGLAGNNGGGGAGTNGSVFIGDSQTAAVNIGAAGTIVSLGQGTVTQATSITTGVTVNASSMVITTVSTTQAAATQNSFTVTNSTVAAASVVVCGMGAYSGTFATNGMPDVSVGTVSAGSFVVNVQNQDRTNALNGTLKINCIVE